MRGIPRETSEDERDDRQDAEHGGNGNLVRTAIVVVLGGLLQAPYEAIGDQRHRHTKQDEVQNEIADIDYRDVHA